jgi:hypothetical protein
MPTLGDFFEIMKKWEGKGKWILLELLYEKKNFGFVVFVFDPLESVQKRLKFWLDTLGQPTEITNLVVVSKRNVPLVKKALDSKKAEIFKMAKDVVKNLKSTKRKRKN